MNILKKVGNALQHILNDYSNKAAKETGFIQRVRKITGASFIKTLLFGWMKNPNATLDALVREGAFHDLLITPQGLDKRFNEESCAFACSVLKEALNQAITATKPADQALLKPFSKVYVHDSSQISLPPELAFIWKGTGGSTEESNKAALKIDTMLELKCGEIKNLDLLDGKHSDNKTPALERKFEKGCLHLKDLGYFRLQRMREQNDQGEYWLSLLQPGTAIFHNKEKLELEAHLEGLKKQSIKRQEYSVEIGVKERLPARLFLIRRSKESSNRQRAAIKKQAQKHGRVASKARLALCDWIILITNAPPEKMDIEAAITLYGARWQIELLFKLWKSQSKLAKSRSENPWRILCEIYIKLLIVIVQHWILLTGFWEVTSKSLTKGVQAIQEQTARLAACINCLDQLIKFLQQMVELFTKSAGCRQNKRRKKPNTWQRLEKSLEFTEATC